MTATEFLKNEAGADEICNINYKPYEYGSLVESVPFKKAVEMIEKDIQEMVEFLSGYGIEDEEKAKDGTFKIWKNHLVIF